MFGNKLRSWMEAVRPKKNKHRKDKQGKCISSSFSPTPNSHNHTVTFQTPCITQNNKKEVESSKNRFKYFNNHETNKKSGPSSSSSNSQILRYSATNLSSPESAYSTGYSTDGTSPGAPPDYTLNNSRKTDDGYVESADSTKLSSETILNSPRSSRTAPIVSFKGTLSSPSPSQRNQKIFHKQTNETEDVKQHSNGPAGPIMYVVPMDNLSIGLMSPRQRNRIRTNPWLPGGTSSTVVSPIPTRQELTLTPIMNKNIRSQSPKHRYVNPCSRRRSISSSSGSSESAVSTAFDHHVPRSVSDEEDCTLNEMMGKYDESYVYEKETDILSDSDPTDCDSDIDTGQDGGDEEDTAEGELDFIDNGSHLDFDPRSDSNTGHCSYYVPNDVHRRRSSRRRTTTRKNKEANDSRKRRSNSNKKGHNKMDKERRLTGHKDGSRSAGATPLSVRRSSLRPPSKLTHDECLMKKRSNSVCLQRDTTTLIDKRDIEADLKYRELIGQAEQILRTMNINGLSPRRLPGPANKRVEFLRSAECAKLDVALKTRTNEELPMALPNNIIKNPSNNFKSTRFSPKKNHITNFIINNSPVLVRKEMQSHVLFPSITSSASPLSARKYDNIQKQGVESSTNIVSRHIIKIDDVHKTVSSGTTQNRCSPKPMKKHSGQPKSILHKTEYLHKNNLSPRHRRANRVYLGSSSSDEEDQRYKSKSLRSCPQSEPVRRKVYFGRNTIARGYGYGKTVAFNLGNEEQCNYNDSGSTENLRHQVLLSTIQNLKKNLEDQSATLQQTYRSTHNMCQF